MKLPQKSYKSTEDLIAKLKSKGIIIDDEIFAKNSIEEIGYYRLINGYRKPFLVETIDGDSNINYHYKDGLRFNEIISLYQFDFNLRFLTLEYLLKIEIYLKNVLSNYIAEHYHVDYEVFFNTYNFLDDEKSEKIKRSADNHIQETILKYNNSGKITHSSIIHHYKKYGSIPIWLAMSFLSFGDVSNLFSIMNKTDRLNISKVIGVREKSLKSFFQNLTYFRNVCAHSERMYCYKTQNKIALKAYKDFYQNIVGDTINLNNSSIGLQDYFSLIIMLKLILKENDFADFSTRFIELLNWLEKEINPQSYNTIERFLGIIDTWKIIL